MKLRKSKLELHSMLATLYINQLHIMTSLKLKLYLLANKNSDFWGMTPGVLKNLTSLVFV
jgi:hypothetical protein